MKFIIFLDILTTMMLPATMVYLYYLIYLFASGKEEMPIALIIVISVVLGVQVLIFTIKRDLIYMIWMIIYTLALPIWTIIIPLYSFVKMDDFSWGSTRKVEKKED